MFSLTEKFKKIYKNLRLFFNKVKIYPFETTHVVEEFRHLKLNGATMLMWVLSPNRFKYKLLLHLSNWKGVNIDISPEVELFEKYRKRYKYKCSNRP